MKIIIALIFICAAIISIPQFAMEHAAEWDLFMFVPSRWTSTTFLELQQRNEGRLEREKEAFITAYRGRFLKIFGDDSGFMRFTAQQLISLSCQKQLMQNPIRALKG